VTVVEAKVPAARVTVVGGKEVAATATEAAERVEVEDAPGDMPVAVRAKVRAAVRAGRAVAAVQMVAVAEAAEHDEAHRAGSLELETVEENEAAESSS
jgi:hypothetical protein